MSPIDEGFRTRIETFFKIWQTAITEALERGQQLDIVDPSINTENCAIFILSAIEGTLGMVKNKQTKTIFYRCSEELKRYLNTLRVRKQ